MYITLRTQRFKIYTNCRSLYFQAFELTGPKSNNLNTYIKFDCSSKNINVTQGVFTNNLDWVKEIYFKDCFIQNGFQSEIFIDLTGVVTLDINGGGIVGNLQPDSLNGLINLEFLKIRSGFPSDTLPAGFLLPLTNVLTIDFQSCGLTTLEAGAFSGLTSLETLDMSKNDLDTFPKGLFNMTENLLTLDLSDNSMTAVSGDAFADLVSLQTLDMSDNSFSTLPGSLFRNTVSIETIDLSRNSISSLPSDLLNTSVKLASLDLSTNSLTELSVPHFDSLTSLQTLDLSANSLTTFSLGLFDSLVSVTKLDLSDNDLKTLPDRLFSQMLTLTDVKLSGNPWNCSCDLVWLSTWSLYTGVTADINCSTPVEYSGRKLIIAMQGLNCISNAKKITSTSTGDVAVDDQNSESTETNSLIWQYVGLGMAGVAILLSTSAMVGLWSSFNSAKGDLKRGKNRRTVF